MITAKALLDRLKGDVTALVADLRRRVDEDETVRGPLDEEYRQAFGAGRTGRTFTEWSEDRLTQVAVAWVLACVFVRFGEDNLLIPDARLAGPGQRGVEARAAQQDFFAANPNLADRDYLHDVFQRAAALPGMGELLGEDATPLWSMDPSADACTALIERFRAVGDDGVLVFDFTDPSLSTRFLGDLYQDLSDHARSTYALLQTPDFVEEFILDHTLTPAIDAFGLANTDLIDPTCGSGHFLLGAFDRLTAEWREAEPGLDARQIAQRALTAVAGVDLNPFAVGIARFRLLVAALKFCGIRSLADAPDFHVNLAVGDSLLWGTGRSIEQGLPGVDTEADERRVLLYQTENAEDLTRVLSRSYTAVVGNPPYIAAKDKALNAAYRARFASCSGRYQLSVPFMERFFGLAGRPDGLGRQAGFVGQITASGFMKSEFGKKLVQEFIPSWDVTHVVNTSGANIAGHTTPTIILFGRNQRPVTGTIRTVMSIRGEPSTSEESATNLVWLAILDQVDRPGSESEFISVTDTDRARFATHPWSIGGGGAAELKERIDAAGRSTLGANSDQIGITSVTGEDDLYVVGTARDHLRARLTNGPNLVTGDAVRDWGVAEERSTLWPFDGNYRVVDFADMRLPDRQRLWNARTVIGQRKRFGTPMVDRGLTWWEWQELYANKLRTPLSIVFAFVATHNHFVMDHGGRVFKQTAPVIKLKADASVDDHLRLVGLLNSSVACFWLKQVSLSRVSDAESWLNRFNFDASKLLKFPIPAGTAPIALARRLDCLAAELAALEPQVLAGSTAPTRLCFDEARVESDRVRAEMIFVQEELDWWCLHLYGLTDERLCVTDGQPFQPLQLGERAFEIVLARQLAMGEIETEWFTRHRSTPVTEFPAEWPGWYRDLVQARVDLIDGDRDVALVERPDHKRRWQAEPREKAETTALANWLLDRLEERSLWIDGARATTRSLRQLADRVVTDMTWMDVARVWAGTGDIDALAAIERLAADQQVPAQAASRYTSGGLAKRAEWEHVWELQRAEDRDASVGRIPVPPRYAIKDFLSASFWQLRGKLDVPKERFISIPGAERDGTMVLMWAGFDHAEQAQALATMLHQRQTVDGWSGEQLLPILVALDEVLPWVAQWHSDIDPQIGQPLADFYGGMVDQALAAAGATRATLKEWRPPVPTRGRRARAT